MLDFVKKSQLIFFLIALNICNFFSLQVKALETFTPNLNDAQFYFLIDADSK